MIWIDVKYAGLLAVQLERFSVKQNQPYLANFRCPICGDSAKNPNKRRGYLYSKPGGLFYKCHNCGAGTTFGKLLSHVNPRLKKEYDLERFKEKGHRVANTEPAKLDFTPKFKEKSILDELFIPAAASGTAINYMKERSIPDQVWKNLYFCDDSQKMEKLDDTYAGKYLGHAPRLIIPAISRDGSLIGVTGRAMDGDSLRYLTIRMDEDHPLVFNLDKVNMTKDVYVTEGPIDSFFINNSVAVGSADLKKLERIIDKSKLVLVFDNQPRNKEVVKIIAKAIDDQYKVVLWPDNISQKDINEMISQGVNDVQSLINNNTFQGLRAQAAFTNWRKIK